MSYIHFFLVLVILFFNILFLLKVAAQSHLSISPLAIWAPGSVKDHSIRLYSNRFPAHANFRCLSNLLLLSSDIALNPDPVNLVSDHFIRNKGPLIGDSIVSNNLDVLALAETHIQISDSDCLLKSNSTGFSTDS